MATPAPTYVMVPVPEELYDEATAFLVQKHALALLPPIDPEVTGRIIEGLDPESFRLLDVLTTHRRESELPSLRDLAGQMEMSPHETLGLMLEIIYSIPPMGGPHIPMWLADHPAPPVVENASFADVKAIFLGEDMFRSMADFQDRSGRREDIEA